MTTAEYFQSIPPAGTPSAMTTATRASPSQVPDGGTHSFGSSSPVAGADEVQSDSRSPKPPADTSSSCASCSTVLPENEACLSAELGNDCRQSAGSTNVRVRTWEVLLGSVKLAVEYVCADNKKNKRSFLIGASTVLLVVTLLSLIQNSLARSSVIFLKTAEDQVGQMDLLLSPKSISSTGSKFSFLNYSQVNELLASTSSVAGTAPRWMIPVKVFPAELWIAAGQQSEEPKGSDVYVLIFDSTIEQSIGLGTSWPYRTLGDGEVSLTASTLRSINVRPQHGEKIVMQVDFINIINFLSSAPRPAGNGSAAGPLTARSESTGVGLPTNVTIPAGALPVVVAGLDAENRQRLLAAGVHQNNGDLVVQLEDAMNIVEKQYTKSNLQFTVVDAIEEFYGKIPGALGNVAVMELEPAERLLRRQLQNLVTNPFARTFLESIFVDPSIIDAFAGEIKLKEYAMSVSVLKRNRIATYAKDPQLRKADIVQFSDDVAYGLGLSFPVTISDVLSSSLDATTFMEIFLNQIFLTVVSILAMLAAMLIYSLLLADVESKTFEYGMLRTLGLRQRLLMLLLLFQSVQFSVPGIAFGLLVCIAIYIPVEHFIALFAGTTMSISLQGSALALGLILGSILPILGMVIPIRRALTRTLRDALDIYHNVVFEASASIQKLENMGLSVNETVLATFLVGIGFVVYYMLPMTFILNKNTLFFNILTGILLAMVVGQVLLSQLVNQYLQNASLELVMWGKDRRLRQIVQKSLVSHFSRNHKTAIMFTLCIAYIIFSGTLFELQATSLSQTAEWTVGSDISIVSDQFNLPLPEPKLRAFLENYTSATQQGEIKLASAYTFVTYALDENANVDSTKVSGIASAVFPSVKVYGVEKDFLTVVDTTYFIPSEVDESLNFSRYFESGKPDVVERMFHDINPTQLRKTVVPDNVLAPPKAAEASMSPRINITQAYTECVAILVSESLRNTAYIDTAGFLMLTLVYKPPGSPWTFSRKYISKPVAFLQKMPSFPEIIRLQTKNAPILISMEAYAQLLQAASTLSAVPVGSPSATDLPKAKLLIRVVSDATDLQVEGLVNALRSVLSQTDAKVVNLRTVVATTRSAADFMTIIFNAVAAVGIIFSFFMLWLSFTANIRENSWEFGVLRAVGLNAASVIRLYLYEAVAIILSSLVTGLAIGITTAVTVTLQGQLFSEMPFNFAFPTSIFVIVTVLSFVVAIFGSYLPASDFRKKQIAVALKEL